MFFTYLNSIIIVSIFSVAMTTCSNTAQFHGGSIIPFPNVMTSYGMNSLEDFRKTGKFLCESPGLYLITAQIMSYSKGAEYKISKNDIELTRVQITPYHDSDTHNYHTGTGIAVVELDVSDYVSVEILTRVKDVYIFGQESCLTIAKLK